MPPRRPIKVKNTINRMRDVTSNVETHLKQDIIRRKKRRIVGPVIMEPMLVHDYKISRKDKKGAVAVRKFRTREEFLEWKRKQKAKP